MLASRKVGAPVKKERWKSFYTRDYNRSFWKLFEASKYSTNLYHQWLPTSSDAALFSKVRLFAYMVLRAEKLVRWACVRKRVYVEERKRVPGDQPLKLNL